MSQPIKLWFSDFWKGFDNYNNYFTSVIGTHFAIEVNPKPDILIHSIYGKDYLKYNCIRVCFTGENTRPDFSKSDYHLGFDYNDDSRYLRWPLFLCYYKPEELLKPKDVADILKNKTRFCAFVVSNGNAKERVDFFHALSNYKKIDSGGRFLNNLGYNIDNKLEFLKSCKFTIAYENASYPGYSTEKIYEPFLAGSIPIYWGNPDIARDFNPKAFINVNDFNSTPELIEYIAAIDSDERLFNSMVNEPCFSNNIIPESLQINYLLTFFASIFDQMGKVKPVAKYMDNLSYYNFLIRKTIFNIRRNYHKINN